MNTTATCSPYHVGWIDVLHVANLVLLLVGVLDGRFHESPDRRQTLVSAKFETAATPKNRRQ